jgi:hypothetical protein
MKYELRKNQYAPSGSSADEGVTAGTPAKAPSSLPDLDQCSTLADLAERYEPEVFDLVRTELDAGRTRRSIVHRLVSNDLSEEESLRIVRAVIEDRESRGQNPIALRDAVNPMDFLNPFRMWMWDPFGLHRSFDLGDLKSSTYRGAARRAQGKRDMLIGMALLGGGTLLAAALGSLRALILGVVVGPILMIRGVITYGVGSRM